MALASLQGPQAWVPEGQQPALCVPVQLQFLFMPEETEEGRLVFLLLASYTPGHRGGH